MIYLLDTNVCVQFLRQRHAGVVRQVRSRQPSELRLCSIVVAELYYGSERSAQAAANRAKVDAFVQPYPILPFDGDAA
jgi:tRNA(fMet)-specific endonuclease VapC